MRGTCMSGTCTVRPDRGCVTGCRLRVARSTGTGLRVRGVPGYGLRVTGCELRVASCEGYEYCVPGGERLSGTVSRHVPCELSHDVPIALATRNPVPVPLATRNS